MSNSPQNEPVDVKESIPTKVDTTPEVEVKKKPGSKKVLFIVIGLFLLIFIIVGIIAGLLLFNNVRNRINTTPTPTVTVTTALLEDTIAPSETVTPTNTPMVTIAPSQTTRPTNRPPTVIPTVGPTTAISIQSAVIVPSFYCAQWSDGVFPKDQEFTFNGMITVTGTGTVTYKWLASPGPIVTMQSLTYNIPGAQVTSVGSLTLRLNDNSEKVKTGTMKIKIFTPYVTYSNEVTVTLMNNSDGMHQCP